ncbi:NUDIX domain-containing protein [Streptomyces sp. NPDC057963]|uniref:NUDIX domain-containing protein n=1 Tax=Streptomyces sp. NPDC057963 TaxID=3346290 RepID=UPI0036E9E316
MVSSSNAVDRCLPLAILPGGTVEATGASPEAALVREAAEEAQLTLAPGKGRTAGMGLRRHR